ncbi:MAG TPA: hypothetical protein DCS97_13320 [Planctomycetes bacterium]|nr:hypothetical protein [Planctomycetota bacterium]
MVQGVYHTHTARCLHASGDVPDYARAAAAAGLLRLGAADHTPLPDGRWASVRMRLDELPSYEAAVAAARRAVPSVEVLLGMECDVHPDYFAWYRDTFLARGYDYLIGSIHFLESDGREVSAFGGCRGGAALRDWSNKALAAIDCGLFAFLGHPDNIACGDAVWTPDIAAAVDEVCAAAAARGVPLELNSLGLREQRGYPWMPFWECAAAHHCTVVLSSDAHKPADTAAGLADLTDYARAHGLRVVEVATERGAPAPTGPRGSCPARHA